jgi:hypothetical protein
MNYEIAGEILLRHYCKGFFFYKKKSEKGIVGMRPLDYYAILFTGVKS